MGKFADRVILILNILAAAGLLISYLAPVVNPAKMILPALFGLAYPYLLMVNLFFLVYWMIRLKKEILISVIIILLGWNHLNNLLPLNFKEAQVPGELAEQQVFKVISYNVRGFDIYGWRDDPAAKNQIFEYLEQEDPDVVCFQEYYTSSRRGETHRDHARKLSFLPQSAIYYSADLTNQNGFGIATYTKYPIIRKSRIPFNSSSNAAMYTDIQIMADTIRVFNVHLQSIQFQKEDYAFMDTVRFKYTNEQMKGIRHIGSQLKRAFTLRADQAEMISNYIKSSPYPVVLMGDFNDTPQSYAYRKIKKGMHDAFRRAGKGFGNTYAGELPSFRIDYILYSNPLESYRFQREKTDFSDHFPISTWLYTP